MVWRQEDGGLWTIATVPVDGDDSTVLISGRSNRSVQLTPDRRTVLYLREIGERITLRAMSADGQQDRALFSDGTPDCPLMSRPTIRADGVLALFCAEASGGPGTLNLTSQDGTVLRVLDRGRIGDPTFTPDGKSIVYWRTEADGGEGGALYRVPADGSEDPVEVLASERFEYTDPVISPDGKRMLASRDRGATREIVAVDVTDDPATDVEPTHPGVSRPRALLVAGRIADHLPPRHRRRVRSLPDQGQREGRQAGVPRRRVRIRAGVDGPVAAPAPATQAVA